MSAYSATDEDFIRRYGDNPNAPDTTPPTVTPADSFAPVTTTYPRLFNPTSEEALMGNVNAAARATTLPGVGQAGSTDITDQTNLNVAVAMERADLAGRIVQPQAQTPTLAATAMDEFDQRRQQIEQQKTQLMAKLGMVPPSAAGFAAVVLPSTQRGRHGEPSDYDRALGQLNELDKHSRQLQIEKHQSSIENAKQAHEELTRNTHIQVSSGLAKVLTGINQINQNPSYARGSPEERSAILNLLGSNDPDVAAARGTKSFENLVKPYIEMHDLSASRAQFVAAFGREPTSVETTATGGVNLRAGAEKTGGIPAAILKDYTALKVNRAEQQTYLNKEVDPAKKPELQKKIDVLDAQIGAVHQQFPQLAPNQITAGTTTAAATPRPGTPAVAQTGNTITLTSTPTTVATQAERDAIPSGGHYIYNGKLYQKK